jgi:hypothetical protein
MRGDVGAERQLGQTLAVLRAKTVQIAVNFRPKLGSFSMWFSLWEVEVEYRNTPLNLIDCRRPPSAKPSSVSWNGDPIVPIHIVTSLAKLVDENA